METEQRPKVGVGVTVFKGGKVLVGKRKNTTGAGEYAWPGGKLEYGESFAACARREVAEECGLEITNIRFQRLANVTKYAPHHFVDIALLADWVAGEPQVLEPEKCEGWGWYDLDNLPEPLFEFCRITFESMKTGQNYYDS